MMKFIKAFLFIALAIVILYQFVIRPIQRDKNLERCLYGAGVSADVNMKEYKKTCFDMYGK